MINEILSDVMYLAITAAIVLFIKHGVPYLQALLKNSKYEWLADTVMDCVQFAEQTITGPKTGKDKKQLVYNLVTDWVKMEKVDITTEQINALIESAVYDMKKEQNTAS